MTYVCENRLVTLMRYVLKRVENYIYIGQEINVCGHNSIVETGEQYWGSFEALSFVFETSDYNTRMCIKVLTYGGQLLTKWRKLKEADKELCKTALK